MKKIFFSLLFSFFIFWSCNYNNHDVHTEDEHIETNESGEHEKHIHDSLLVINEITKKPFFEIIRTSGEIISAQGDEVTLSAPHEGIVVFKGTNLFSGKKVNSEEVLIIISGKELLHDNLETSYQDLKTAFEKTKNNYERSVELNKDKIISDKELMDIKQEYEKVRNQFEVLKKNYSSGGQQVASSIQGYIKDVFVTEGQFVSTGQPLIKLTKNKRLVIKADVPQRYFHMLENIHSANFVTVYDKQLYDITDLNGKLISFGKTTASNPLYIPVYFEIDNKGSLLSGSYIEVFLKTRKIQGCIVIPKSAVLEESGRYYVYVEDEHEDFEKRYIKIDCTDGFSYHITEGLNEGEHVIFENPYRIKLSTISSAIPAHNHNH